MRARWLGLFLCLGLMLGVGNLPAHAQMSTVLVLRSAPSSRYPQQGGVLTYTLWVENPASTGVIFRNPSFLLPEGTTLIAWGGFLSGSPQSTLENGRTRLLWQMTRTISAGTSLSANLWVQVDAAHRGGIFSGEWRVEEQTASGYLTVVQEEAAPVLFDDPAPLMEWQVSAAYAPVETEPPSLPLLPGEDSLWVQVTCLSAGQCLEVNLLQGGQTFSLTLQGEGKFEGNISPVSLRSPYHWEHNCVQAEILLEGGQRARRVLFCPYRHQPALRVIDTAHQPLASAQVEVYRLPGFAPGEGMGCPVSGWESLPPVDMDLRAIAEMENPLLSPARAEPPFFNPGFTVRDGTLSLQLERGCYYIRVVKNGCKEGFSPLYGAPPVWQDLPIILSCTRQVYLPFIQR